MRFSQATVLAFAALSLAAPAFEADNKNIKREDCDKTSFHGHHKHKRAVAYDYAYVTVTVDGNGNPITTVSLLKQLLNPKKLHLLQLQFLQLPPSFKMIH